MCNSGKSAFQFEFGYIMHVPGHILSSFDYLKFGINYANRRHCLFSECWRVILKHETFTYTSVWIAILWIVVPSYIIGLIREVFATEAGARKRPTRPHKTQWKQKKGTDEQTMGWNVAIFLTLNRIKRSLLIGKVAHLW